MLKKIHENIFITVGLVFFTMALGFITLQNNNVWLWRGLGGLFIYWTLFFWHHLMDHARYLRDPKRRRKMELEKAKEKEKKKTLEEYKTSTFLSNFFESNGPYLRLYKTSLIFSYCLSLMLITYSITLMKLDVSFMGVHVVQLFLGSLILFTSVLRHVLYFRVRKLFSKVSVSVMAASSAEEE